MIIHSFNFNTTSGGVGVGIVVGCWVLGSRTSASTSLYNLVVLAQHSRNPEQESNKGDPYYHLVHYKTLASSLHVGHNVLQM